MSWLVVNKSSYFKLNSQVFALALPVYRESSELPSLDTKSQRFAKTAVTNKPPRETKQLQPVRDRQREQEVNRDLSLHMTTRDTTREPILPTKISR